MRVRDENIQCMLEACDRIETATDAIFSAAGQLRRAVATIRNGLVVEAQLGRVVNPIDAPEIPPPRPLGSLELERENEREAGRRVDD
jgi:hypothetical protein